MPRVQGLLAAGFVAWTFITGCDSGGECSTSLCQDPENALFCDGASLHSARCRGPNGCQAQAQSDGTQAVTCDMSGAQDGDACYGGSTFGVCLNPTGGLVCDGASFHQVSCPTRCVDSPDGTPFECR
jgi:hypothetical protein